MQHDILVGFIPVGGLDVDVWRPSDFLELAHSAAEIVDAHKGGRIASVITVESGHSIGTSLGVLRTFQRLGVRALTLTHNCDTPW